MNVNEAISFLIMFVMMEDTGTTVKIVNHFMTDH